MTFDARVVSRTGLLIASLCIAGSVAPAIAAEAFEGLQVSADADSSAVVDSIPAADSLAMTPPVTTPAPAPPDTTAPHRESRNLYERAVSGAGHFVSDAWYILSAPARLNLVSAAGTAAVFGAEAVLYANDEAIYAASQRNQANSSYRNVMDFADSYAPIGFMPHAFTAEAGVAIIGYATGYDPLKQIPIECIESHIIAGSIRNVLKPIVGRAHPYEKLGSRHFEFDEGTSFPSGHTSIFFELATIVSEHVDRVPVTVALFAGATLGAWQRIDSGNHWPSDVFLPAVTGTLIAHTVVQRNAARRERDASSAAVPAQGWTPLLAVGTDSWRLGVTRGLGATSR